MPGFDGFQIMEEIRARNPDAYLPILVLTGDRSGNAKTRALSAGATDFLTKPFDSTEVVLRVANLLETRRLHQDLRAQNLRLEEKVQERTAHLKDAAARLYDSARRVRLAQEETIKRLSLAAEHRDNETGRHIERMSRYGALLAQRIG